MICRRCKREGEHKARGLCNYCYQFLHRGGGLADYPRTVWDDNEEPTHCVCETPAPTIGGECSICRRRYFSPEEIEEWRERLEA